MLDSICMNIPEWGNAKTDIAEIRSDIVCTLKNVETILNDLFAFHKQNESNAPSLCCPVVDASPTEHEQPAAAHRRAVPFVHELLLVLLAGHAAVLGHLGGARPAPTVQGQLHLGGGGACGVWW